MDENKFKSFLVNGFQALDRRDSEEEEYVEEESFEEEEDDYMDEPEPQQPAGEAVDLVSSLKDLEKILQWEIPVLIEADGARRLPAKVPAKHEPVILPCTTYVLSVYGLDSIGQKIEDVVFRHELAEKLLNKKKNECVSAEDIAILASSVYGGRKGCPEKAGYTVVLNKADNETRKRTALAVCRALEDRKIRQVIVTGRQES